RLWSGGGDFEKLAKYNDGDSAFRKGMGEGNKRGAIRPPELEEILFRMKEKQVQTVEMPTGIHIVKLVKREFAGTMPFDEETQNTIRDRLR
ncbi:peptidylprolyl isomerase, partial [Klebsiella pneumoniae]|uniref:peptidylprolyl isomerase n=1 Tax=Klebsiella pneumoniae TaxID=573 RepID=UPI003013A0A6